MGGFVRFRLFSSQLNQIWCEHRRQSSAVRRALRLTKIQIQGDSAVIELLESRALLSAASTPGTMYAVPTAQVERSYGATSSGGAYTPAQLQSAYGFNKLTLNGTGQTIAIVDAYNDPTIQNDLIAFDKAFGLANPPSLTVVSQTGSATSLPPNDPSSSKSSDWEVEESLDVEWAHALAPGAKIILVEANSASYSDLMTAVRTAANLPGVSVVSMSWGGGEFSSESAYDSIFTTPSGHQGVTFVASTGDSGAPGGFPAYSSNVVAVGGTTLKIDSSGNYVSESAWSGSGGGISQYESQPTYQKGVVTQTTTKRAIPDVSFDADPNTGVAVYDSFSFGASTPWAQIGGTSLAAPSFASVISIVDQGRVANGLGTLDGASQTLPMLYHLDQTNPSAFHDITSGNNGYAATAGYDLVTGIGSPVVNIFVPAMDGAAATQTTSKLVFQQLPTTGTVGKALSPAVTVAVVNQNGQVVTSDNSTVTISIASGAAGFSSGSTVSVKVVNGIATFSNLIFSAAGTYTLTASDTGATAATSSSIKISAATTTTLTAPQNVVATAMNSTTAQLSWGVVTGAQGYRIYQINGTQSVLLGTVGSTTTNIQITGLTAGSTVSFKVEAYNGTTVADSVVASVTIPLASNLVLTETVLSSNTVQLNWNSIAGAQGYRVYLASGSNRILLGTVPPTATSAKIIGVVAGTNYQFQVEAFQGASVIDSNWVSVNTATAKMHTAVAANVAGAVVGYDFWQLIRRNPF